MRCLHVSGALTLWKHTTFFWSLMCDAVTSLRLSHSLFVFVSPLDGNTNVLFFLALLASFHQASLFYLISCSHRVPSGCMNNTCCHACVCLCAWSHPPACLPACLPWCCIEMISEPFFMALACFLGMWILAQDLYHTPLHPPALPSGYPCPFP